jgi:hypothetical protein
MKLLGLRLGSTRQLKLAAFIACMPFVFSFIVFNLLDLDGSNLTKCFDRSIIEGDIDAGPRIDPVPERVEFFRCDHVLTLNVTHDDGGFHIDGARAPSRLENARTHLYYVSLPRDSVPG